MSSSLFIRFVVLAVTLLLHRSQINVSPVTTWWQKNHVSGHVCQLYPLSTATLTQFAGMSAYHCHCARQLRCCPDHPWGWPAMRSRFQVLTSSCGLHQIYTRRTQRPANLDHHTLKPLNNHTPSLGGERNIFIKATPAARPSNTGF